MRRVAVFAAILCALAMPHAALAQDLDRDRLDDRLEQALLERFLPSFLLSAGECDGQPASFLPGTPEPRLRAKDGTIYGQVFPVPASVPTWTAVEIHFFHLWNSDCGRGGHPLDAEHVSALVEAPAADAAPEMWTATMWYAAAHEDTICDASSGALAIVLNAEFSGPAIYVSRGKHASYLTRGQAKWGCGADVFREGRPLAASVPINIGERNAPLNGADWVTSNRWAMAEKCGTDFTPDVRARLSHSNSEAIVSLKLHLRTAQSPVLAGDTALSALITAGGAVGCGLRSATAFILRGAIRPCS